MHPHTIASIELDNDAEYLVDEVRCFYFSMLFSFFFSSFFFLPAALPFYIFFKMPSSNALGIFSFDNRRAL